ncbi:hypothetical protein IWW37_003768 [Coemansia sp. RSA 2050]|nr:hypothetical protein IWW37_003768 [Coemansia sp. RSA 2050]KAJ2732583.1 hypothetical protein IW152_003698 [Coemansia sp. BCRC 34962]
MSLRLEAFERVLFGNDDGIVDTTALARLCFDGVPEAGGLRAVCWQVLLGCLPRQRREWIPVLHSSRAAYAQLAQQVWSQAEQTDSEGQRLLEQIEADVQRTMPDISLFHSAISSTKTSGGARTSLAARIAAATHTSALKLEPVATHGAVLGRILLVYAKHNRGAGYAQGMNEVLGPLYYAAWGSCKDLGSEADAYHMLVRALRGAHLSLFMGALQPTVQQWWAHSVRALAPALWAALHGSGVRGEHFSVRWVLVWGAREFALPDVLALWDALIADRQRLAGDDVDGVEAEVASALGATDAYEAVDATIGRVQCVVYVRRDASGDDGCDRRQLGFMLDFFAAVVAALGSHLVDATFEKAVALLQDLPRDAPELSMHRLLRATRRLRQERADRRAVLACRAVLASKDEPKATRFFAGLGERLGFSTPPPSPTTLPLSPTLPTTTRQLVVVRVVPSRLAVVEIEPGGGSSVQVLGTCDAERPMLGELW